MQKFFIRQLAFISICISMLSTSTILANSASFISEIEKKSGNWAATLYRNESNNRRFCALEAYNHETVFRIVRYRDGHDTFLEIFDPSWRLIEGKSSFSMRFSVKNETYEAELVGKSYSDAYIHEFTDSDKYLTLLGIISQASWLEVLNPNGIQLLGISGRGSSAALKNFSGCIETGWPTEEKSAPTGAVRTETFEGELKTGTLDSGINDYTFITQSLEGDAILEVCKMGDVCKVKAVVRNDIIIDVISVQKISTDD